MVASGAIAHVLVLARPLVLSGPTAITASTFQHRILSTRLQRGAIACARLVARPLLVPVRCGANAASVAHPRRAQKRKKRFQGNPELAQKHRKVRHVQANPVKAKAWYSPKVTCACGAFDKGGKCRCGPPASVVTPEYERQDEFFSLTTFARLARTKVALR